MPTPRDLTEGNGQLGEVPGLQLGKPSLGHLYVSPRDTGQQGRVLAPDAGGAVLVDDVEVLAALRLDEPVRPIR